MSMKVKGPKEDPETKRRRQQAETRAEASRTESTQRDLDKLTEELLRVFGRRSPTGGLAGPAAAGFGGAGAGGGAGGGAAGAATGGGSFDPGFSMLANPLFQDFAPNFGPDIFRYSG